MSLTRGPTSLFPCVRCLIAHDDQGNLRVTASLRTVSEMKRVVDEARGKVTAAEREALLKSIGLRGVDVRLSLLLLSFSFTVALFIVGRTDISCRTCSGRSRTQIRTRHCHSTGFTLFLLVYFATTCGKNTSNRTPKIR